ncbi:acyltransferase [Pseudomonas sp.]|uniref:acyltransferase family protein n=1 Tax=Pseudomonas sp. TaxID=306 RepID=UPI00261CF68E|nr:acyltransferase [Pseudomonas sp.]
MRNDERRHTFEFINGLRGLAALQVVALHYCSSFLPRLARAAQFAHYDLETRLDHSPAFFMIDGYSAVYLFFVMSGFVLAPSFLASNSGIGMQTAKRFTRLYLPVVGALAFALVLILLLPSAKESVAIQGHSGWVHTLSENPLTVVAIVREFALNSMLLSYNGTSIFNHLLTLPPVTQSLDAPLWTIHFEFWGSVLVILVCAAYRRLPRPIFWFLFAVLLVCTGYTYFSLFLVGFALFTARERLMRRSGSFYPAAGFAMVAISIVVSSSVHLEQFIPVADAMNRFAGAALENPEFLQRQLCAIMLFVGVILIGPYRRWLESKWALWLGRISFSLYLVHFPILFTATFLLFKVLATHLSYGAAALSASAIALPITLFVAHYFEKYIDRGAISFSRRIEKVREPAAMLPLER